jgi:extracellular elastinolytic metalloproteinase
LNNAAMYTPADGIAGEILMFLWDATSPMRDGSIENDILVHEATHGTTNRMTGGGTGRCLQIAESQGLGEGWSDAFAEWTEQKNGTVSDFTVGGYVTDNPGGIRTYPYSTDKNVNPFTYNTLLSLGEVHDVGEVWANMLHNVYAALVAEHGWSATAKTDPTGSEGNVVYMHLFLDALKLQPCQPEFPTARNAWIQADQNRYNGANKCLLWKAFASRGLGPSAGETYENDFSVPTECQ